MEFTQIGNARPRVLCLHGIRTNAAILQFQLKALQKSLKKDDWELFCIDAPNEAAGPPSTEIRSFFGSGIVAREWWDPQFADGHRMEDPDEEDDGTARYFGLHRTVEVLHETLLSQGPFDAILGFSQQVFVRRSSARRFCPRHEKVQIEDFTQLIDRYRHTLN